MKTLLTGGAGFIGSHIADRLVNDGHDVVIIDNFFTGKKENLAHLEGRVQVVEGDIRDAKLVNGLCKGVDWVVHQAAMRSVPVSLKNAPLYNEVNIGGTYNLLESSRLAGVKRFVFASSSSVYGTVQKLPLEESDAGNAVRTSPYAITKFSGEDYCRLFHKLYGLETVSLRYFNVFGERQDPKSEYSTAIPRFILQVHQGLDSTIYGHGDQRLDFTYVGNIVNANIRALTAQNVGGEAFNVGNGQNTSVNSLFEKICKTLGKDMLPLRAPFRFPGEDRNTLACMKKAEALLGYSRELDFEAGLKKTAGWFVKHYG